MIRICTQSYKANALSGDLRKDYGELPFQLSLLQKFRWEREHCTCGVLHIIYMTVIQSGCEHDGELPNAIRQTKQEELMEVQQIYTSNSFSEQ